MTAPFPEIRVAAATDVAEVEGLLESAALTRDGLAACAQGGQLLVARADDGCLMGCVALELFDDDALLRSLAVIAGARGHGLGGALLARAVDHARAAGAREAWLLTETAGPFFAAGAGSRLTGLPRHPASPARSSSSAPAPRAFPRCDVPSESTGPTHLPRGAPAAPAAGPRVVKTLTIRK